MDRKQISELQNEPLASTTKVRKVVVLGLRQGQPLVDAVLMEHKLAFCQLRMLDTLYMARSRVQETVGIIAVHAQVLPIYFDMALPRT
ncbi:hypothetical protein JCM19233_4652 [Vibrio astriarenae]|nr:hypothetical protein JCM19233_4652 [Vibrio sp. C7]